MDVRYERPIPDLTYTVAAPLILDIGDHHGVQIERWCLDGIEPPDALVGASGFACLTIPFQGFGISFRVLLRPDPDSGRLRFHNLGQREERVLRHFYRAIVTGRAVPTERMIAAMDTPVEPVPMHQTPLEAAQQTREGVPRAARAVAAVAVYAVLAFLAYEPLVAPVAAQVTVGLLHSAELAQR
jgi:hypothetical protein